jgi:membrane protease subunit HflC
MTRPLVLGLAILAGAIVLIAMSSLFVVTQTQQALVLQLGEPVKVVKEPGLKVKLPFVQNVLYYDRRLLEVDPPADQVLLSDQKRVVVDAYARFSIIDPLLFYQSVNNEANARNRIGQVINSSMRRVLGGSTLASLLSNERERIMADIQKEVQENARRFGVEIVDVRLRRADLPEQTSQAIFNRMRSERERDAKEARAQGQEQAQQIRSRADREKTVLIAEAQRESQIVRGEGDAQAIRVYAESFGKDPQFFAFYRSMQAYKEALGNGDTTMVLSPDSDFFRFFGSPVGIAGKPGTPTLLQPAR